MNVCFSPGHLRATPGALDAFARNDGERGLYHVVSRHLRGDWGDVCPEDGRENEESLARGFRLISCYHLADETRVWVITEADRSATTVLLPEEY